MPSGTRTRQGGGFGIGGLTGAHAQPILPSAMLRRAVDWFFRDRTTGRIVIAQWPNLPLWLFGIAALASLAAAGSIWGSWAGILARLSLAWWGGDELLRGVNPWRRSVGAAVLIGLAAQLLLASA